MASFLEQNQRTHTCGELGESDIGKQVTLMGWVDTRRDHGGCLFVDLRDRYGITQVVFRPDVRMDAHESSGELRHEFCIGVVGEVVSRGTNANTKLSTGTIEVNVNELEIFSRSETPPFVIEDDTDTNEALRLKYRYLDLRRAALKENFLVRSQLYHATRQYLHEARFVELETPCLVKYTPGGARNFLVPSRLSPASFYALAESPQIFKQLFMVAGFDRYFQLCRCFRDEDLRQDRQPEFTQIDIEMSFVTEDDVHNLVEGLMAAIWKEVLGTKVSTPFPRMSYDQAMARYGTDKPDLRLDLELGEVTEECTGSGFQIFEKAIAAGSMVKAMRVPHKDGAAKLSRSILDGLTPFAKPYGAKGVAFARVQDDGGWKAPFAKAFSDQARDAVNDKLGVSPGDVLLFVADKPSVAHAAMSAIRLHIGEKLDLIRKDEFRFLWVIDMPMFEQLEDGSFVAAHHPFTSPRESDIEFLLSDPGRCRARAYDLVLNGNEIAGGSIRIHRPELQEKLFGALGLSETEVQEKFGFLLEAFKYGPPPHGGIAAGLDRLAMLLVGAESLRDVIAFPKTQKGADLMTGAPGAVAHKQLDEVHIQLSTDAKAHKK